MITVQKKEERLEYVVTALCALQTMSELLLLCRVPTALLVATRKSAIERKTINFRTRERVSGQMTYDKMIIIVPSTDRAHDVRVSPSATRNSSGVILYVASVEFMPEN
jgi:hypothetical protein